MCIADILFAEPQIKKHLTAEEHAMRRAEMARRRKNLSEKRNEEEKVRLVSLTDADPQLPIPVLLFPYVLYPHTLKDSFATSIPARPFSTLHMICPL